MSEPRAKPPARSAIPSQMTHEQPAVKSQGDAWFQIFPCKTREAALLLGDHEKSAQSRYGMLLHLAFVWTFAGAHGWHIASRRSASFACHDAFSMHASTSVPTLISCPASFNASLKKLQYLVANSWPLMDCHCRSCVPVKHIRNE